MLKTRVIVATKGVFQLIEYDEEKYATATEVAQRFRISYSTCKSNVLPVLTEYYLPGKRRPVYRLIDVEELAQVRVVEKQVQPLTLIRKVAP